MHKQAEQKRINEGGANHAGLGSAFAVALGRPLDALEQLFVEQLTTHRDPGEAQAQSLSDLAANIVDLWSWSRMQNAWPAVRSRPANADGQRFDLIEVADTAKPFLLDSVIATLSELGHVAQAISSAVVPAEWAAGSAADAGEPIHVLQLMIPQVSPDRREELVTAIREALADVGSAVADYPAMKALLADTIARLEADGGTSGERQAEEIAFLKWLASNHFVLLGTRNYRYPMSDRGELAIDEPLYGPEDGLGVLRDSARTVLRRLHEPSMLTPQLREQVESDEDVIVAKSNFRSRVHRRVYCDYVGVKLRGADGRAEGEVRFLGLFTAEAYDEPASQVPLVRRKVRRVLESIAETSNGVGAKRLRNVIANYPRDELFQMRERELRDTALGVAQLQDRPRVRLFVRHDPFKRFVSVLLFVPRERYDSDFRERAGAAMAAAFGGHVSAFYPFFGDSPLARVHFIIGVKPGEGRSADVAGLEAEIAALSRTWEDRFEETARANEAVVGATERLVAQWRNAFSAGYQELYSPEEALFDLMAIEEMRPGAGVAVRAYRRHEDGEGRFRFKLYHPGKSIPLADVLPILQDMGLKALIEEAFAVRPAGRDEVWIHEFQLEDPRGAELTFDDIARPFENALVAAWTGETESDGFNRLLIELGVSWREAALVRALARYRQQSGLDPSQAVQIKALVDHAEVARLLLELFKVKFDPATGETLAEREASAADLSAIIEERLESVPDLEADRVLRRLWALILAVKRTNFFQADAEGAPKPHISLKIACRELADLPEPKPFREIFVSAPHVEGAHLRFGPVARGGLRWSDRRDDFRAEVLGLVKAQQVKNSVIVPVGSKGGFYVKNAPAKDPAAIRAAGVEAYRTFLSAMLDITDNIDASGAVVAPPQVVAHDEEDPYLVVAADKGTATFSDIANDVSASYGFWLGDAFASGGSAGYDHKAMGITAQGAWEAVKRHFRELGKDIQAEPFSAAGVGDMSGDVFGNGMLLSQQTRLVAAFDHRDIFIDPNPDPATSWAERKRLFELPRSSWQDYDRSLISKGGGVFSRQAKSIELSPEIREALGVEAASMTPQELMRAILCAPVELLYMGGIGTYVKAETETNQQVSDKANDAIRVNGRDLRARIAGEGANLGFTQAGRIEYARAGGRNNTDAIDNAGGVDSSDLEVNIKILTSVVERSGDLSREDRDTMLAAMTDDVATHVLASNYAQTLALSLADAEATAQIGDHARMIADFERAGRLNPKVEGLPDAAALAELQRSGGALTRPEIAVLLAYAKLALFDEIVASDAPDDAHFEAMLRRYFPEGLRHLDDAMAAHPLRRDIIATVLANRIVNIAGPTFPTRLMASAGCDAGTLATTFSAAMEVFRLDEMWQAVHALDGVVAANIQYALYQEIAAAARQQTYRLARGGARAGSSVGALVEAYQSVADSLAATGAEALSAEDRDAYAARLAEFVEAGVPASLAERVALLRHLESVVTVANLAAASGRSVDVVARLHNEVGSAFGFDALRMAAAGIFAADRFDRLAIRRLVEQTRDRQEDITRDALASSNPTDGPVQIVAAWSSQHEALVARIDHCLGEVGQAGGDWSLGKLTVANAALADLL